MEEKDLWSLLRFFLKRLLLFCLKSAYGSFKHFLHHVEVASVDSEIWRRCTGQVLFLLTFKLHFIFSLLLGIDLKIASIEFFSEHILKFPTWYFYSVSLLNIIHAQNIRGP
jgi:hypothetical protein